MPAQACPYPHPDPTLHTACWPAGGVESPGVKCCSHRCSRARHHPEQLLQRAEAAAVPEV